ncbi:hypothetical protein SAMN04488061_2883 [Filomicrobium insigne]|uniref:Uncharacterized protein n=1 Tax=Filomicrobium insigne TaxID=418854 RepID=A0A1H0SFX6_9HYPH|nr:hypothetical protein [Filomicrobium insigne]SDP40702.1 hypothetical protein SAMN04488061_2883 [Filomicrobium insigne]
MAKSAEVGALRVRLTMDAGEFTRGTKNAQTAIGRLGRGLASAAAVAAKAGAAIAAAVTAAGVAVAAAVRGNIAEIDRIGKMAQSVGIAVDELSRLKHAAELSGTSLEGLATGVKRLSANMQEIAAGEVSSAAARSLKALGISATDSSGALKSATAILTEVAGRFQGIEDGAGKTALAMALFGKSGADLIPMLNAGSEGLRAMMREADELGIVFDTKTAAAAAQFQDTLHRLKRVKDGIVTTVSARMLPTLQTLASHLLTLAKDTKTLDFAADALAFTLKSLVSIGILIGAAFKNLATVVVSVAKAVMASAEGEFSQAYAILKDGVVDVLETTRGSLVTLRDLWLETGQIMEQTAVNMPAKVAAPIIQSTQDVAAAQRDLNMAMREGQAITESFRQPYEILAAEQSRLNELFRRGAIDATTLGKAGAQAAWAMQNAYASAASGIGTALTNVFNQSKGVAIASALINTYEAFTRALANPPGPPFSYAQAAAALANGFAQVQNIRSTSKSGSGGGSGGSSGGGGAGRAPASTPTPAQGRSLTIQGFDPSALYSGSAVKGIIDEINAAVADGAVLISTETRARATA